MKAANDTIFNRDGQPKPAILRAIERALDVQHPLIVSNLDRLRRRHPEASPAELARLLERDYLRATTAAGAAVGATAAVPAVGTIASLGLSAVATVGFLEATALYTESIAELHGIHTDDPERSRAMVMAILMGEEGSALVRSVLGASAGQGATQHWGQLVNKSAPTSLIRTFTGSIQRRFLRKFLARQGGFMRGRPLPFGVGAVVGGTGNHLMGKSVVRTTREAFGPLPRTLPGELANELQQPDS
ncbi:hypothetical protein [Arthrobacter sp. RIT-PI-e]|uniref:hypothetical protein n=1 Tax=Arthrobacter sp. RIT-PI-e TaxID=1681197 RepID=UPI000A85D03F|nr:hypothetical protein [Arthrobacter sp. RIT-PI-e]